MLPDPAALVEQGVPDYVAAECGHTMVSANYHPGWLCCLREHYRFPDGHGRKWPVRKVELHRGGFR